jgi:hypothetical protein
MEAFYRYLKENNYTYMLKFILMSSDLSEEKMKLLLEKTAKCALELNNTDFAWKTALYAGRF